MANPITWQNVTAPSNVEAMRGMEVARQSFNDGFGRLGSALKEQQATNQGVIDRATFATEQDYLNALDGARSVDALTAMRNSGALDQRFASLGAQSQAKLRSAAEARMLGLQQQDDSAYTRGRTRTRDAVADTLSAVNDPVALATAKAKAALQPGEASAALALQEQTARLNATNFPVALADAESLAKRQTQRLANAVAQDTLNATQTAAQQTTLDSAALVDKVLNAGLQRFNAEDAGATAKLKQIGVNGGYPLDGNGLPNVDGMTPAQLTSFNKAKQGITVPSSSAFVAEMEREMARSGATATAIADAKVKANSLFKSAGTLSTEDQGKLGEYSGFIEGKAAEAAKSNIFYTPPNVLVQAKADVLGKVESLIKDGPMTKTAIRGTINQWMDKGIEITKDGKKVFVPVPPKVIEAALMGGLESDTWINNNTDKNMLPIIEELMTSEKYKDLRKDADYFSADGHKAAIKAFSSDLKKRAGTVSSSEYLTNANNRIEQAAKDAAKTKDPVLAPAVKPVPFGSARLGGFN